MKPVRIALIGINVYSHAFMILHTLKSLPDCFEIAGYALVEDEEVRFAKCLHELDGLKRLTLEEIWRDETIRAVAVETEEKHLTKYALLAARHGKDVHMEKPGGIDQAEFEELVETVKQNKTVLHIGYMYRYNPFVQEWRERVKNGELGELYAVEAQMNCLEPEGLRRWLAEYPGGMMFFLGCHLVDLVLQFSGMPKRVIPLNKASRDASVDNAMAVLEYDRGVSFVKTYATETGGFGRRQLVLAGTKGTVEIKPLEILTETPDVIRSACRVWSDAAAPWSDPGEETVTAPFNRYGDMMRAFSRMVNRETENPFTPDYEARLHKLLLQCCGGEL